MKLSKILFGLMLGIFLLSSISAIATPYGKWQDGSSSITIFNGQSISFNVYFEDSWIEGSPGPTTLPMNISAKLYDSANNLLYTFIEQSVSQTYYFNNNPIEVTPSIYSNPGSFSLILSATDRQGTSITSLTLTVNPVLPTPNNNPPVITSSPVTSVNEDVSYSYDVNALDADGNTLVYSLVQSPAWLSIDSATGLISGKAPLVDSNTDYNIIVGVSDGVNPIVTQPYTLTVMNIVAPDTTAPVITILGSNPFSVEVKTSYSDAGATAADNVDGDITSRITAMNNVNINVIGIYAVTYAVSDAAGNPATATRNVSVVDTTAPVITLIGSNPMAITKGGTYTEPGATANDNYDATISVAITGSVNTNVIGTYTITYTATDSSGNPATATRAVTVSESDDGDDDNDDDSDSGTSGRIVHSSLDFYEAPAQESETSSEIVLGKQAPATYGMTGLLLVLVAILVLGAGAAVIVLARRR